MHNENHIGHILRTKSRNEVESFIRSKTRFVGFGSNKVLCNILGGYKFFVSTDDVGISPHLVMEGFWEYWLTKYMADVIKPGDTVLDVGANLGYYSILMSALVGPSGKVHCIEPNPVIADLLVDNLSINGFASISKVERLALFDFPKRKSMKFYVPKDGPGGGCLVFDNKKLKTLDPKGQVLDIEAGNISESDFPRLDFIKIDVEGAELGVLNALQPLIRKKHPAVICEINFSRGYSYEDVFGLLSSNGKLHFLDYDSKIHELTKQIALGDRLGEDLLVYRPPV